MDKEKCQCHEGEKCTCGPECECHEEENVYCHDGVCEVKPKKEKKDKKLKKNDKKVQELEEKVKELQNKMLLMNADSINFRKRKEEEVARMLKFCNEDLIKDILPVIDNFERALTLAENNNNKDFQTFIEGYKMVYCSFENILSKYGVKAIDGFNKEFDPTYHNAVMMEHKDGIEPGMVLEVMQKGYLYKDKVIRPAMVKVSE